MVKYILGGGISGLIWGFYNKDFLIVSPKIGGQFSAPFSLGPRYLEVAEHSKKLLKDLEIICETKTIKVGYHDTVYTQPNEKFRTKYCEISRGVSEVDDKTSMNSNKKELLAFAIDIKHLIEILRKKLLTNIIPNRITSINPSRRSLKMEYTEKKFYYDEIISTIPLKSFMEMNTTKKRMQLYAADVTYVLLEPDYFDMKQFDFVYVLNKKFHRVTKTKDGLVADWLGNHSAEECKKEFGKSYKDSYVLKDAQIINVEKLPKYKDITFSGRYGAWNRKYKIEKVIEDAIKYRGEKHGQ